MSFADRDALDDADVDAYREQVERPLTGQSRERARPAKTDRPLVLVASDGGDEPEYGVRRSRACRGAFSLIGEQSVDRRIPNRHLLPLEFREHVDRDAALDRAEIAHPAKH